MGNIYTTLGFMSGTSMDGVDASIIKSDGKGEYSTVINKYFKYNHDIYQKLIQIRTKISNSKDLKKHKDEIQSLERDITLFHAEAAKEVVEKAKTNIDLIGFHGQTIFHNSEIKVSKQLGDGKLLSQLMKKKVVYDFRNNDLKNGGQGAPLTPIFHNTLANMINKKFKIKFPVNVLNIGGIANMTLTVSEKDKSMLNKIHAYDLGPGNCLIDEWIRKNSNQRYDKDGLIAKSGKIDDLILNQAFENFRNVSSYDKSLDINDFDIFFAKGLSLENGAATITDLTATLISDGIKYLNDLSQSSHSNWLVCGGGRKNKFLLERIKKKFRDINNFNFNLVDNFEIDGDFVESQAFAYLAIRSLKGMYISFPNTTRCKKPLTGGKVVENY
tara:strand:- start:367 stop:1521 length:1155 start_codon:yes stop_codon:yes gene_type:complete